MLVSFSEGTLEEKYTVNQRKPVRTHGALNTYFWVWGGSQLSGHFDRWKQMMSRHLHIYVVACYFEVHFPAPKPLWLDPMVGSCCYGSRRAARSPVVDV